MDAHGPHSAEALHLHVEQRMIQALTVEYFHGTNLLLPDAA